MRIEACQRTYPFRRPFTIASQTYVDAAVVEVAIHQAGITGRGEAAGVDYLGETCATMLQQIDRVAAHALPQDLSSREWLQDQLPPGGARNAIDCALWDLAAKSAAAAGTGPIFGQTKRSIESYITIGLDTPDVMARDAADLGAGALIKIKLGGVDDRSCLRAVRAAAPDASLIVDLNQAWSYQHFLAMEDALLEAEVLLVEQPLPAGQDEPLLDYAGPLVVCADESCHDRTSLPAICGKYRVINIKLDKAGGLTEALALADAASSMGLGLMVGCMGGSSLGVAPALVLARTCQFVDLDCPLQLQRDIVGGLHFVGHRIGACEPDLWG